MSFYYIKDTDDCKEDYISMDSSQLENECNKVKGYLENGDETVCGNICKVNLSGIINNVKNELNEKNIDDFNDEIENIKDFIDDINDSFQPTTEKEELVYKYQRLYDLIFELKKKDEITDTDKKILQKMLDYIEDKVTKYLDARIDKKLSEEKFKLIIENNHLKKEIDTITLRSQQYLQDIEEDNKFKKGQDIIRERIEFYNKWLHGLKKTTLIVHFILVFIVIGMIVYKLS